jgi:hypothetical protein
MNPNGMAVRSREKYTAGERRDKIHNVIKKNRKNVPMVYTKGE